MKDKKVGLIKNINVRYTVILVILLLYALIRLAYMDGVVYLEDHDSVGYLRQVQNFSELGLGYIEDLSADALPFYPVVSALLSSVTGDVESAARLCSLMFSIVLFVSIAGIGWEIKERVGTLVGLGFLALNPELIRLSYSVLTEPTYIALVYLGVWVFFTQFRQPRYWKAGLLGLVFGFGFLCRVEGILFVGFIPIAQGLHYVWSRKIDYDLRVLSIWSGVFVLLFSLVAIPQIWHVSNKVGTFALNGRQVWAKILNAEDGKTYEEKIYGLDYSASKVNLRYLQENPDARASLSTESNASIVSIRKVAKNFYELYISKLGSLIGPLIFAFFVLGLLHLYRSEKRYILSFMLLFLCALILAPLLHNVALRHIAVIGPVIILISGIGVRAAVDYALLNNDKSAAGSTKYAGIIGFAFVAVVPWFGGLYDAANDVDDINREYSPKNMKKLSQKVSTISDKDSLKIVSRKGYLPYFSDSEGIFMPYTDYDGLVKYMKLNNADVLYLEHRSNQTVRPFFQAFDRESSPPDFELIYRGRDSDNRTVELYRFSPLAQNDDSDGTR